MKRKKMKIEIHYSFLESSSIIIIIILCCTIEKVCSNFCHIDKQIKAIFQ